MGETPTHGKIVVNVSRNDPSTTASKASSKEGTSSSAAAAVEAALAATCSLGSSGEGLDAMGGDGLDAVGGDGPLDASGRPGWSVGDSGKGGVSTGGSADAANGAVLKKVEWYGTIRLLVFVRKGRCFECHALLKYWLLHYCYIGIFIAFAAVGGALCTVLLSAVPPLSSVCGIIISYRPRCGAAKGQHLCKKQHGRS